MTMLKMKPFLIFDIKVMSWRESVLEHGRTLMAGGSTNQQNELKCPHGFIKQILLVQTSCFTDVNTAY